MYPYPYLAGLNAVRDQGVCSAGYAIAATSSIEAASFISTGAKLELAPQQLLDCSQDFGNRGCVGGNVSASYVYIQQAGITSEKKYPYKGFAYSCQYRLSDKMLQILGCVKPTPLK